MNIDIRSILDRSKLVVVTLHPDNKLYVQFPKDSKENIKLKVINNGNDIGIFPWRYLRQIAKSEYAILVLNTGSIFGNKDELRLQNTFQVFELALSIMEDTENVIFANLVLKKQYNIAVRNMFNTMHSRAREVGMKTWRYSLEDVIKSMDSGYLRTNFYNYYLVLAKSFFEIVKPMSLVFVEVLA